MDINQKVKLVEDELLNLIVAHLLENKIQADEARKLAADFLALLPFADKKDLLSKLKNLGEKYDEALQIAKGGVR